MGIENKSKLNLLISQWPDGRILTTPWLRAHDYKSELIQKYKKSHWIQPLGSGAYKKYNDIVHWSSALECIQSQLGLNVYVGGKSALELLGKAQYLKLNETEVLMYANVKATLPAWMKKYPWGVKLNYQVKKLFSDNLEFGSKNSGFAEIEVERNTILISAAERAFLEYLDEMPKKYSYREALEILENLISLRSAVLQNLLQNCTSLKVKRLFLHLADRVRHPWFEKLDLSKIELGSGKRMIFKNGVLDKKYNITVPKDDSYEEV